MKISTQLTCAFWGLGAFTAPLHGQEADSLFTWNRNQQSETNHILAVSDLELDWSCFEADWEALEELRLRPVNLNCMKASELERLYWLNPFQIQSIQDYVRKTGGIKSRFEIPYIHGFTQKDMEMLDSYVCFLGKGNIQSSKWKTETKSILESSGRFRNQIKVEQKNTSSTQFKLLWLSDMKQTIHINQFGGSLEWRGKRYIKQVILGDFGSKWGQGLLVHHGLFKNISSPITQLSNTYRSQALSQNPAYPHYRGISITATTGAFQTDLIYSFQDSLQGLARIAWKNRRISCALQCRTNLTTGAFAYSMDQHINLDHHQLFSESAFINQKFLGVFGYLYQPSFQHKAGFLMHTSTHSYGIECLYEYAWNAWNLQFSLERQYWNHFRYRVSLPSEETIQKGHLLYKIGTCRFLWKWNKAADYINVKKDIHTQSALPYTKERHRFRFDWQVSPHIQINTEYQRCIYQLEGNPLQGNAVAQEIQTKDASGKWNVRLLWAWYLSKEFDSALYIFETNFLNRFSIPVLYGEGFRYNMQLAYTPKSNQLYTIECIYQKKWQCTVGIRIRWETYSSLARISRTLN